MPELPDITIYLEAIERFASGESLDELKITDPFVLRSVEPAPGELSGIGNAYSNEILHRARLSPFRLSDGLTDDEVQQLFDAIRSVLDEWTARLRDEVGNSFPDRVTAFRDEMAVHGRFGKPCPECGAPVQRIRYAASECNYCAGCQTAGRILADRSLSRLLKADWPKTLEELERRAK